MRTVALTICLAATWLLLSGHYDPLLLSLGAASCVLVAWIAWRMDVVDHEGFPIHLSWQAVLYWPWLIFEIIKSNIDVALVILRPSMPISPTVLTVKTTQGSELGQVIYANSITLTPGTVSLRVYDDKIDVHALTKAGADGIAAGEMDRRVTLMDASGAKTGGKSGGRGG